jgi:hypothetical protein
MRSLRKFPANGYVRVSAVNTAQSRIHKSDIRTLAPKLRHGLDCIRRLGDESHIRLRFKNGTEAFANNRMVNAQDANGFRGRRHRKHPIGVIVRVG